MEEMDFYHTLHTFENGKMASQMELDFPNILFLDLAMPKMNGWVFLGAFNKIDFQNTNAQQIRIVVLSSSVNPIDIEKANSHSLVERYIVKPLIPSDLLRLLENSNS